MGLLSCWEVRATLLALGCSEGWNRFWASLDGAAFPYLLLCPPVLSLQLPLLEDKLQGELPAGARVVSGRFPLPTWQPVAVVGEGLDRVWAYDVPGPGPAVSSCGVSTKAIPESSSTSIPGTLV